MAEPTNSILDVRREERFPTLTHAELERLRRSGEPRAYAEDEAWLAGSGVMLDAKGFVTTGAEAEAGRPPLETSLAGAFAIGDVRSGSVKRVAAAVGEGAQVVAALHAYLAPRVTPGT